jgi:purine-binding chemotaxis protein CheW
VELLTTSVSGQRYAVEVGRVDRVVDVPPLTRVPRAPGAVLGVANVQGELTVVLDLHGLVGLDRSEQDGRLLVFEGEHGGHRTGVIVDSVGGVEPVPTDRIAPAGADGATGGPAPFNAVVRPADGAPWNVLDPERLTAAARGT